MRPAAQSSANVLPRRLACLASAFLIAWASAATAEPSTQPVDLELVVAIDCSSSVSNGEFRLQIEGIASAFRHPDVVTAIELAGPSGIAVTLMQWSSKANQVVSVDWRYLYDAETAATFADRVLAARRAVGGGSTAIGSAILQSARHIGRNGFHGARRVIDISGDGVANQGPDSAESRDLAASVGITINGLAITNKDRDVVEHYSKAVIGGPSAFMVTAQNYRDFANAMLRKLVIEIGGPPVSKNFEGPLTVQSATIAHAPRRQPEGRPSIPPAAGHAR